MVSSHAMIAGGWRVVVPIGLAVALVLALEVVLALELMLVLVLCACLMLALVLEGAVLKLLLDSKSGPSRKGGAILLLLKLARKLLVDSNPTGVDPSASMKQSPPV